jgi:hypothetical protein
MRKVVTAGVTALGVASASFALAVLNPFAASAQDNPTTTVPGQTAPAPGNPGPHHNGNCPNMGNDSGSTSGTAAPAGYGMRHGGRTANL